MGLLEDSGRELDLSPEAMFRRACGSYTQQGMTINGDVAWQYYQETGFLPFFVADYCREVIARAQNGK
jgi:hypothetical protein